MRWNALNLPQGIGGWIWLMGFVDSRFHFNTQLINAKFDISTSSTTWTSINNVFETLQVGTMCRVLVANLLLVGLPRLMYCYWVLATNLVTCRLKHGCNLSFHLGPLSPKLERTLKPWVVQWTLQWTRFLHRSNKTNYLTCLRCEGSKQPLSAF
jgi:hypothetical protein